MRSKIKSISSLIVILFMGFLHTDSSAAINPTGGYSAPYLQADFIQSISEYSSALINPALLYRVNQIHIQAGFYRWNSLNPFSFNTEGFQQGSFIIPIRLRHTVGFTIINASTEYIKSTLSSGDISELGSAKFGETWIIPHYSFKAFPWLSIGLNPKVVIQNQFEKIKVGWGVDLGFYATLFDNYRIGDMGLSLNFQDVKPAVVKWDNGSGETEDVMTTRFRGGLRYSGLNDRLVADIEVVIDNLFGEAWSFLSDVSSGNTAASEFSEKIGRVGFHLKYEVIPQLWVKGGWTNNNIPFIGINFNVIYPLPERTNFLSVDWHMGYSLNERERGPTSMLKVSTDFGLTREQRESKRLYDKLVVAPMTAYNEAMRLYIEGRYWDAAFAFGKVLVLYPNFHLSDKATYYMGDCYSELRLNRVARSVFKDALAEFTISDVRADFLYGLERLDYREGRYKDALKNHAFIVNLYEDSDVKPDADYVAGQIHYKKKNISVATSLFQGIPQISPSYKYAQYSLATLQINNGDLAGAEVALKNIISDTSINESERMIKNAAYNKLGQLYFERVEMRKAVQAFKQVDLDSRYGDQSILGIAWAWIKVNRPQECLITINRLITTYPKSPLIPEAFLLKGYASMLITDYRIAEEAFLRSQKECRKEYATEDDLIFMEGEFRKIENNFDPTGVSIRKNALRKPTERVMTERSELNTEFLNFDKKSREFFNYGLTVDANQSFFRRRDDILADAEYALAKVTKMLQMQQKEDILNKESKKQQKIDSKIEELERKLNELE